MDFLLSVQLHFTINPENFITFLIRIIHSLASQSAADVIAEYFTAFTAAGFDEFFIYKQ